MFLVEIGLSAKVASASDATITEYSSLGIIDIRLPMTNDGLILVLYRFVNWNMTVDLIVVFYIESPLCFFEFVTGNNFNLKVVLNIIRGHEFLSENHRCMKEFMFRAILFSLHLLILVEIDHLIDRDGRNLR